MKQTIDISADCKYLEGAFSKDKHRNNHRRIKKSFQVIISKEEQDILKNVMILRKISSKKQLFLTLLKEENDRHNRK